MYIHVYIYICILIYSIQIYKDYNIEKIYMYVVNWNVNMDMFIQQRQIFFFNTYLVGKKNQWSKNKRLNSIIAMFHMNIHCTWYTRD